MLDPRRTISSLLKPTWRRRQSRHSRIRQKNGCRRGKAQGADREFLPTAHDSIGGKYARSSLDLSTFRSHEAPAPNKQVTTFYKSWLPAPQLSILSPSTKNMDAHRRSNSPALTVEAMVGPLPPALHLLQPPAAPRLLNVSLPDMTATFVLPPATTTRRDVFPIDLSRDLDLELLSRALPDFTIPAQTTIHVLPTSRDRALIELNAGRRPTTAMSIIRRLHSVMRAPLSLQVYQILPYDVQQSVFNYFMSCWPNEGRRWQDFLNGYSHSQGPTGAVLLQGHFYLWGFSQDHASRWIVDVDVRRAPLLYTALTNGNYSH
ncbi:hypothetical protein C8R44DRAFT_848438 [Mycena epipterygia]|nr:hypothetical protein C8R44DRAFT_848438 [Mycena epipterygia]